jgi:hypothetical protein
VGIEDRILRNCENVLFMLWLEGMKAFVLVQMRQRSASIPDELDSKNDCFEEQPRVAVRMIADLRGLAERESEIETPDAVRKEGT